MHFVPDLNYNKSKSFYTPALDKFAGYSQFPYKMSSELPAHLGKAGEYPKTMTIMRKCQSEHKKEIKAKKNTSVIL